jgi:UDP-N-acetylglucosamine diphosphorylase/glucosamine-1-phosphate N-acetyltransferase
MRHVILFDGDVVVHGSPVGSVGPAMLSPLTDLRASFDVRTGVLTTIERWSRVAHVAGAVVPEAVVALTRERHGFAVNTGIALGHGSPDDILVVNGACPLPIAEALNLAPGAAIVERATGHLIAWRTTIERSRGIGGGSSIKPDAVGVVDRRVLLTRPWHVRTLRDACIAADLSVLAGAPTAIPAGVTPIGGHPIHIEPSARVYPTVVLDAEQGPIWIGAHVLVRPGAILIGPCAVGEHSTVLDRTLVKGQTAIGPHCKVAGEIGGTIIQGYSNKGHDGHLGDSWLGEWVNFGAGTTNSNLLNTYGEVIARAAVGGSNERTGETFLGAIIGDHVKMAICTRIMTGSILHTGSMFAQSAAVSGTVGPFTWATDDGRKPFRHTKFVEVVRAAMGRRKIEPSAAYLTRLEQLNPDAVR